MLLAVVQDLKPKTGRLYLSPSDWPSLRNGEDTEVFMGGGSWRPATFIKYQNGAALVAVNREYTTHRALAFIYDARNLRIGQ